MTPTARAALVALLCSTAAGCHPKKAQMVVVQPPHPQRPMIQPSDPKLVEMMVEPTAPLILASSVDELGIHVRISGKSLPHEKRPPLDLALVLDTSGSMEGNAIDQLKASANAVVDAMQDGDRLAIITFDSKVAEPLPSKVITKAIKDDAHAAVAQIVARGTTDLQSGLSRAVQELAQRPHGNDLPRIVLLSDGVPNTSLALPQILAQIHASGYSVTTLGLGNDFDTQIMTRIASETGGSYHYIDKPEQIAAVFDDELTKMTTVVARNLQLQLTAGPNVALEPLAGYSGSAQALVTTIGDLPADGVRDLVIPVKVTARGDGSTAELVDVSLQYTDVIGGSGSHELTGFASSKANKDAQAVAAAVKIDLEVARVRASAASAELEAMNLARAGQIPAAKTRLATAMTMVRAAQQHLKAGALDSVIAELTNVTKEVSSMVLQQAAQVVPSRNINELKRPAPVMPDQPAMAPEPAVERDLRSLQEKATVTVQGRRN